MPALGTNDTVGLVARTGSANVETALLEGCAGIDTAGATLPASGGNEVTARVTKSGFDSLRGADALVATALPYDVGVVLMLHRIEIVATRVSVSLVSETGCAL